jgi:hypothetical protein
MKFVLIILSVTFIWALVGGSLVMSVVRNVENPRSDLSEVMHEGFEVPNRIAVLEGHEEEIFRYFAQKDAE